MLYRDYPSIFAKEQLELTLDNLFEKYLDSRAEELLLLWSRQTGKTTGAAAKVCHRAMFYPESLCLIVSASQRQSSRLQHTVLRFIHKLHKKATWKEIPGREAEIPEDTGVPKLVRASSLSLELDNGSEVISVPASPDTVRGYAPNMIIVDEAAFTPDPVYFSIRPMRAATGAPMCVLSSAGSKRGFFYEAWTKEEHWEKIEIRGTECPRITRKFLDGERLVLPDKIWHREYNNEFMDLEGAALDEETIQAMFEHGVEAVMPGVKYTTGWNLLDKDVEAIMPVGK
jgi:hypothetical protein